MIRIGIAGYGNLGRGVECALQTTKDMELVGVFTRRDPAALKTKTGAKTYSMDDAKNMADDIDVMILCGGSANDLPTQTVEMAQLFNVVDSFDTHAKIPQHFAAVDASAKESGKVAVISAGWDPGSALESRRVSLGAHWVDSRESSLLRRLERGREIGR